MTNITAFLNIQSYYPDRRLDIVRPVHFRQRSLTEKRPLLFLALLPRHFFVPRTQNCLSFLPRTEVVYSLLFQLWVEKRHKKGFHM